MRYLAIVFLLASGCYFTPCDNPSCKRWVAARQPKPVPSFQNLFLARQIALNKKFKVTDAGGDFLENSDGGLEQMAAALRMLKGKPLEDGRKKREEERRRLYSSRPESTYERVKRQMEEEYVAGQNRKRHAVERKRYDAERKRYARPLRRVYEGRAEPLDVQEQEYFDEDVQETW